MSSQKADEGNGRLGSFVRGKDAVDGTSERQRRATTHQLGVRVVGDDHGVDEAVGRWIVVSHLDDNYMVTSACDESIACK